MCVLSKHTGRTLLVKPTGQIKYKDMHLRNSCAYLQLNNICAVKRQNPGAFPSEDFHSFLMSTIISHFIGAFHLEAPPDILQICVYIPTFAQQ